MRRTKSTVVALSTVAALVATGGVAAAVAGGDANPVSADTSQSQAQTQTQTRAQSAKDGHDRAKRRLAHAKKRFAKHAPKGDGSKALCKHAPRIDKRIDRVQNRLDGGLRTRGSIDRLEKRIENAKEAGHGVIADFLSDRLDDRRELKDRLNDREDGLKKVRAWCATQDFDKGGKNGGDEDSGS